MARYLFYNPSGPAADDLLANLPADVEAVPFGWTPEIEADRNALLAALGVFGVSSLPCVLYLDLEHEVDDGEGGAVTVPEQWREHRWIDDHATPEDWNWDDIAQWYDNPIMTGDERVRNGKTYRSLVDYNVWEPGAIGTENVWMEVVDVEPGAWAPGQVVAVDDLRAYQGTTYRCVQAHTTQAGWEPPNVPALWAVVV